MIGSAKTFLSRHLVRDEWHIVISKTGSAYAVLKLAQFGKLTSRLAFDFFFFFPRLSLLAKEELLLCHSKYLNLTATQKGEVASKVLLNDSLTCGVGVRVERIGRSQTVLVSSFFLSRKRNQCWVLERCSQKKKLVDFLMCFELQVSFDRPSCNY